MLADLWERVEKEDGGLQEHQPLRQSPAAARRCLHLGTQAEDPRSLPAQALPQAQEAAVAGVCLVSGMPTRFPQNAVGLTPPSSLLLPPLASPCLLTLPKFCFPCFESVPSISHGPRSPASLASLLPSLSAQSLLTMTLVAFLKPWAHQGVDVLIQKAQNAFLKRVSMGSQFVFVEMSWVALLNHWLWSQRQQGWQ